MHHIYHTEGIILGSKNYGEAGKYYFIFTRDLGMIYASAQGVRKLSSKLRFILQDFSYLKIDFIRGKDFWRITSASKTNKLDGIKDHEKKLIIVSNLSSLLKRLLAGEEANGMLFADLMKGLSFLEKTNGTDELESVELIIVLRILNNLGYLGNEEDIKTIMELPFEEGLIIEAKKKRRQILFQINKALGETHL